VSDAPVFEVDDEQAAPAAIVGGAAGADGGWWTVDRDRFHGLWSAVHGPFTK